MARYIDLQPGDPAPWFQQRSFGNPRYVFDTVGGRYVVLGFYASAAIPRMAAALARIHRRRDLFDDVHATFFGVSLDPQDESAGRVADRYPGCRYFWDFDGKVSRLYGALPLEDPALAGHAPLQQPVRPCWMVLDPTLRVLNVIPIGDDGGDLDGLFAFLAALPPPARFAGTELQAPVILLPQVFEPALCAQLVALYEADGGTESGFMRDVAGKTVSVHDHSHKRRRDVMIEDGGLIAELQRRVKRRINPELMKVHQFTASRMERHLVACYAAEEAGHFQPHRDNTTAGTAHRRFAVSINLSADFDGGEVNFPEYGPRGFKPPVGGALVFSCSLLHQVTPVTRGRRYAYLPFLYDEAAARQREANNDKLGAGLTAYKASRDT
jgi:predicted 2-oxoglutarate/Fe(II)-dependent dioxygenase YbiX/peroxiredoxin